MVDAIIIGKGPAGISAALYIKRAGCAPLVIGKGIGALEKAEAIDNYYAAGGLSGKELAEKGIDGAAEMGIPVLDDEAVSIMFDGSLFEVKTEKENYTSKSVLLATGSPRKTLRIKGFEEYRGKGISFCAVCDGFFYRGKRVALIGGGSYAAAEAAELKHMTDDITLFTNGAPVQKELFDGLVIVEEPILKITGGDRAERVVTDKGTYETDGIFVALGTASAADFAQKLGVITEQNRIVVDERFQTNVPGVFAAGDCTGGWLQIAKAVYEGARAGIAMAEWVRGRG